MTWTPVEPQPFTRQSQAPEGTIWVCVECERATRDLLHGPDGWDESCAVNAVLCYEQETKE